MKCVSGLRQKFHRPQGCCGVRSGAPSGEGAAPFKDVGQYAVSPVRIYPTNTFMTLNISVLPHRRELSINLPLYYRKFLFPNLKEL